MYVQIDRYGTTVDQMMTDETWNFFSSISNVRAWSTRWLKIKYPTRQYAI